MSNIIEPNEKWTRYIPSPLLSGEYYLTGIQDDLNVLNIFLKQDNGQQFIKITYIAGAYRNTDETIRMGVISELQKKYGSDFHNEWSFFKVENSAYLEWLAEQSYGYANAFKMQHFVIMAMDFIIDIAATDEPIVTILSDASIASLEIMNGPNNKTKIRY